jgi:polygalacturonase
MKDALIQRSRRLTFGAVLAAWCFASIASAVDQPTTAPVAIFSVKTYGALGDGKTNDLRAIQKAVDACNAAGGGIVDVPAGTYLACGIVLKSHVNLHLDSGALLQGPSKTADYPAYPDEHTGWSGGVYGVIGAHDATDIALTGEGRVDAAGQEAWAIEREKKQAMRAAGVQLKAGGAATDRPRMVQFLNCQQITVTGVTLTNSQMWTLVFNECQNIRIDGLTILAPPDSPETDGIDIRGSRHALITHCHIDNGDDNVAITGSRKPLDGAPAAQDVEVRDCNFFHGHGVSIGSPTMNGVRDVRVHDCTFDGTTNGIRIKSMRGRGGAVEDIRYDNLKMTNVNPAITINAYYVRPPVAEVAEGMNSLTPIFKNIRITNLSATCTKSAGMIVGLPESEVTDIVLENVTIKSATGLVLRDVKDLTFKNVTIEPIAGPKWTTQNAKPTVE